jgi:uncharacterized membrane protein YedE/YeeE
VKHVAGAVSFLSGLVFAIGLGVAGMGRPAKVLAFLDIAGAWDPSLAFVMVSAIAIHMSFALRAKRGGTPILTTGYALPKKEALDVSLFVGAAIFGLGWGLVGYCPGPAVESVVTGSATSITFVAAMLVGLALPRVALSLRAPSRSGQEALDLAE